MWLIAENLRGFVTSRSPLILFMLCLGLFAILLLTLAYLVKSKDLQNPDEQDWNSFLDGFKKVQFCMVKDKDASEDVDTEHLGNQNLKDVLSAVHNKLNGETDEQTTAAVTQDPNEIISVDVPMWVEVKPTVEFVSRSHTVTHLSTSVAGNQLGFEGVNADAMFNVTLTLPYEWNSTLCQSENCKTVKIQTCVSLHATAGMFPISRIPSRALCKNINNTGGAESHYTIVSKKRTPELQGTVVCDSQTGITFNHNQDPTLMIMLTLQDRSAINLHLMHTSFFLFVMVITLLCYGIVRGRHSGKVKKYHEVSAEA